ncbi:MAG: alkaline phosphatase family protein, partial [Gemmatimonadota bacterium]|nr:alkaline phosphatase family protein [Gemmatimonadota bacterium]
DPERSPDVMMHIAPLYLVGSTPATHGSAHLYDTHVPLIFLGGGAEAGIHAERVRTVDVAPTLAEMLGVPTPDDLDGRVLTLRP